MLRKKTTISPEDVLTLSKITEGNINYFNIDLLLVNIFISFIFSQGIYVPQMQMFTI